MKPFIPSLCVIVTLAACSSAPGTIDIATGAQSQGSSSLMASVNATVNRANVTLNGVNYSNLTPQNLTTDSEFDIYTDSSNIFYFVKETENGKVEFAALNPRSAGTQASGAVSTNFVGGEIEKRGSATYTGGYLSLLGEGTVQPFTGITTLAAGEVTLNANFEDAEISGAVTNRVSAAGETSMNFSDITLHTATIEKNGRFSGTVSGGEISTPNITPTRTAIGTWQGTLAGENAEEALGIIDLGFQITDGSKNLDLLELGGFHAEQ